MKTMKKFSLWTMSLLTLLFVAGCSEQQQQQTTAETTTEAPAPVALEGEWQAIDFRDTLERTFFIYLQGRVYPIESNRGFRRCLSYFNHRGNKGDSYVHGRYE